MSPEIINKYMEKLRGSQLISGAVKQNYKEPIKHLLATDDKFSFMYTVKGTPSTRNNFFWEF